MGYSSLEEVKRYKKLFVESNYPRVDAKIELWSYEYFVLPQSLNAALPNFALMLASDQSYVQGVSDSVKPEWRDTWMFHEYYEYVVQGPHIADPCMRTLEVELSLVEPSVLDDYVQMRTKFFTDLVEYAKIKNPQAVGEFKKSRDYLIKYFS